MRHYKAIAEELNGDKENRLLEVERYIVGGWKIESTHAVSWNDDRGNSGISMVFLLSKEYSE